MFKANSYVLLERTLLFLCSKCLELFRHKPALFSNRLSSKFLGLLLQNIPNTYSGHCGPDISEKQQMGKIAQIGVPALHSTFLDYNILIMTKAGKSDSELLS